MRGIEIYISVRPEDMKIGEKPNNVIDIKIEVVEYLGSINRYGGAPNGLSIELSSFFVFNIPICLSISLWDNFKLN